MSKVLLSGFFLLFLALSVPNAALYANDKDVSKSADIIELLELTGSYKLAIQAMSQVMTMMKDSFNKNRPNEKKIPDEAWAKVINEVKTELDKDSYYDLVVPIYEKYLTKEDIRDIISFYKSDAGRKFISVMPEVMKDSSLAGQEWAKKAMQRIMPRIERRLKELGYPSQNVG